VAVLFCDLTGSTALGEQTDPEALRTLLRRAGCHPGVLKDLMGHESIKTTIDTYGHLYPEAKGAPIVALDLYLESLPTTTAPSVPHAAQFDASHAEDVQKNSPRNEGSIVH
jgi:hypothetical protein